MTQPAVPSIVAVVKEAIDALPAGGVGAADPADSGELIALLRALHRLGRRDLPLGRLVEGHVDAMQIVDRLGSPEQRARLRSVAALGVWNAALPGEPLQLDGEMLSGGKAYASGAGVLSHALVTAETPQGAQLLLLDLAAQAPTIDRSWWQTIGMQRSETHLVRWCDVAIADADRIGAPGDYAREPWFSGGALRFVAVQAGGVAALFDHSRDHLLATGRAEDPHQSARLASLFALAQGAADAVRGVVGHWFDEDDATRLPRVAAARLTVADLAERAIGIAQAAVGLQGMFTTHPLSAVLSDLAVYLRQPAPDAQRMRVAAAAAAGQLRPEL